MSSLSKIALALSPAYQPLHPDLFRYDNNLNSETMKAATYAPKHSRLYTYDESFLDPVFLRGQREEIFTEAAEQIYEFRLFTSEFCRLLIEEAEHCGQWRTAAEVEDNPYADIPEYCEPDTTQHLDKMPGLRAVYEQIIVRHLKPLMEQLWITFKLQKIDAPYILKYSAEPDAVRAMAMHHDLETVTLVTYLNEEFTGGGTYFPRWNYHTGKPKPGSAILYPGGLSHEHEGVAITEGKRYLLCGAFY